MSTRIIFTIFILSFACLAGCVTTEPVAPYERGHLSETGMAWEPDSRQRQTQGPRVYQQRGLIGWCRRGGRRLWVQLIHP